jgi:hypothetical protein
MGRRATEDFRNYESGLAGCCKSENKVLKLQLNVPSKREVE